MSGKDFEFLKGQKRFALLVDAKKTPYSTGKSILAYDLKNEIAADSFSEFSKKIKKDKRYFGYISYDIKNQLEDLKQEKDFYIKDYPNIWFGEFEKVAEVKKLKLPENLNSNIKVKSIRSQFTKKQYISKVEKIRQEIRGASVYQVNLTNKFYGEFEKEPDHFSLFSRLISLNPVPFAAYVKINDLHIISASPELFLRIDEKRNLITCPIKGTSKNSKRLESEKEEAENLMITDLMRNDISRVCLPNSVKVKKLFGKESFNSYSHLYSTISGKLKPSAKFTDVIKNIFPPGSMTGAPKIAAMNMISELEEVKRGIYSGIMGYFEPNGKAEFSVIIRTLIIKGKKFEFQVGGGITYDSDPEKEYQEILTKAAPIFKTLGIKDEQLKKLSS